MDAGACNSFVLEISFKHIYKLLWLSWINQIHAIEMSSKYIDFGRTVKNDYKMSNCNTISNM